MSLRIIEPGLATLVVDYGRPASRSLGVSVGGAADRVSLALGNALVGNPANAAALEITMSGPTVRAECDLACVVFGAPFEIDGPFTTEREGSLLRAKPGIQAGTTFTLRAGEELAICGVRQGLRAYLCVRGGFDVQTVLGSKSAFVPLERGALLECSSGSIRPRRLPPISAASPIGQEFSELFRHLQFDRPQPRKLRVLPGSQEDWFDVRPFYDQEFTIRSSSNRMGLRLQGQALTLPARELVSEPVSPGAVQVTRDGQCIILGVDGQTIGGYPKIAHVISADLDLLGQLRPGERIRFELVDLESAAILFERKQAELQNWLMRLRM